MTHHPPIDQQITFLYTDDLAKTTVFYEEVLGLELALDQGICRIYRVSDSACVGICQRENVPADKTSVIFTLITDQVDEWYTYLQDNGVTFEKNPIENPKYQIYHCFLRDPNGYLIEIQKFLGPRWK
jgi:catechol 2,3-dioxygenase-like lactoylglutathione lyase family enzyme